ncbi:uncharacterized protein LOC122057201 [Macadamia integrifolia]|uniref:uncharacterized protein LOC122057201 n=1 Tax=Macadamia integrifolia TaxID=60698 RepID=UPI001C532ACA|nr:uncharacterized protein LOC122057201 [Macadamia integrifolia]
MRVPYQLKEGRLISSMSSPREGFLSKDPDEETKRLRYILLVSVHDAQCLGVAAIFYVMHPVCVEGIAHDMLLDCSWESGAEFILSGLNNLKKQNPLRLFQRIDLTIVHLLLPLVLHQLCPAKLSLGDKSTR